jgi:hypothetical protein
MAREEARDTRLLGSAGVLFAVFVLAGLEVPAAAGLACFLGGLRAALRAFEGETAPLSATAVIAGSAVVALLVLDEDEALAALEATLVAAASVVLLRGPARTLGAAGLLAAVALAALGWAAEDAAPFVFAAWTAVAGLWVVASGGPAARA